MLRILRITKGSKVSAMLNLKKIAALSLMGSMLAAGSLGYAHSLRTPAGDMPMVHWAVVESTPGDMAAMGRIAQETVGPQSAGEAGTYALYGGVDAENPDVMRLLEVYESYEAYRIHSTSEAFQAYRAARLPVLKNLRIMEANGLALEQKDEGVGTLVYMHRYEVIPEKLAEYQQLAIKEACRAVQEEAGVMGMFVTAEHDAPNVIHIMEIYRDREGFENYQASKPCRDYLARVMPMFSKSHTIKNLPTKIVLTKKGKALAK